MFLKETLWRVTYKKKKEAGDGDKLFHNKKSAQDKKEWQKLKHFFPLSVNGATYSAVEKSLEVDYFSF